MGIRDRVLASRRNGCEMAEVSKACTRRTRLSGTARLQQREIMKGLGRCIIVQKGAFSMHREEDGL